MDGRVHGDELSDGIPVMEVTMHVSDVDKEDTTTYRVVVNDEEQYSILAEYKESIAGWRDAGKVGSKAECMAYINEVWLDMTPLSLRKKMAEWAKNPPPPTVAPVASAAEKTLVDRLSDGDHAVEVGLRPEKSVRLFKEAIDRDFVHIKFTGTRGGTELGMRLDRQASNLSQADFTQETGTAHVEGILVVDYVRVRCIADIDLKTLNGRGYLVKLEEIA
jgi:uncharacterized protein YbdZ (MbtH family)